MKSARLRQDCQADLYALMEKLPKNDAAWNLLDAFDAVTNGMENPEAMNKTIALSNPELEPWKLLVKAIAALYSGNNEKCRKAAEALPEDSAPGSLKPLFRAWLIRQNSENASGHALFEELTSCCDSVTELFRRLIVEPHPLSLVAEQAEEALRQGLEEQFFSLSAKVLVALKEASPSLALRYAAYCLHLVQPDEAAAVPAQPDLFMESPAEAAISGGPAREKILSFIREKLSGDIAHIEKASQIPASFEELARELPPAARYLGPGIWIKAIKDSFNPL